MNAPETAAELALRMETLAIFLSGKAPVSRSRTEMRFGSRGSLSVEFAGAKRGSWFDHESGTGSDSLDFVRHMRGGTIGEALAWARDWLGHRSAQAPVSQRQQTRRSHEQANDDRKKIEMARQIWAESVSLVGTIVERYLATRGLALPNSGVLRFHPRCPSGADRLPAMVALMTNPVTGEPSGGVHRTFLTADGSGKAQIDRPKAMLGPAGIIRLSADENITCGLGLAEGIETSLSILQIAQWAPMWAAGSSGAIRKFPVLNGVESLTIFADADDKGAGMVAAHECAERWRGAGREVTIEQPPIGADWNDMLGKGGR